MSESDNEKPVFDTGALRGIGHNQGPPLDDPEPEPDADTETQPVKRREHGKQRGPTLSAADKAQLKQWEKSGQLDKVTWDSPYGSDVVDARAGAVLTGKVDGLVSRRGKRRIIPGATAEEDRRLEHDLWKLQGVAQRVLHGRFLDVFERLAVYRQSVEEVAAELGLPKRRIYKIYDKCKEKIKRAGPAKPEIGWQSRPCRCVEVREYTNDTNYIDFDVIYWNDGHPLWIIKAMGPNSRADPATKEEPMEKWQSEERAKLDNLRERMKRQAAHRGGTFGDLLSQKRPAIKTKKESK